MEKVEYFYNDWADCYHRTEKLSLVESAAKDSTTTQESHKIGEIHVNLYYSGLFADSSMINEKIKYIVCEDFYIKVYKESMKEDKFNFNLSELSEELEQECVEITKDTTSKEKMTLFI